ncbi:hypothetical protein KAH37_05475 [bacterium]|nr:hypothetical protein [bacterium]
MKFSLLLVILLWIPLFASEDNLSTVQVKNEKVSQPSAGKVMLDKEVRRILWKAKRIKEDGEHLKSMGVPLLIPGVILAAYGWITMVLLFVEFWAELKTMFTDRDAFIPNSSRRALAVSTIFTLILGVPMTVGGAILTAKGRAKIDEAKELRNSVKKVSFSVLPILAPQKKMYGLVVSLRF